MLFPQPLPALEAIRHAVPCAGWARMAGGDQVSASQPDSVLGTARFPAPHLGVRPVSGWLPVRRLKVFMAGREKYPGTGFLTSFQKVFRVTSGWLCARAPGDFFNFMAGRKKNPGTGFLVSSLRTASCAASGWLCARMPGLLCERGTAGLGQPATQNDAVVRAGSGVFSGRPSRFFSPQVAVFATAGREQEDGFYHLPVMPAEVAAWMQAGEGRFIIDGTLGGGGHTEMLLQTGATVLGVDRDPEALAHARARLTGFGERFSTWEGNFSRLQDIPEIHRGAKADGLLLDLGVSSRQLDAAERGFSFMREGPLDMRMGPSSPRTAAEVVNQWSEAELARIFFEFGEESRSRRIAAAIMRQRAVHPFQTTLELAACVEAAVGRHGKTHPATRVFQAIRMAVNEELESLAQALAVVPAVVKPGGRVLVITFHSLEDRLVKRYFRHHSMRFLDDPGWAEPRPNPDLQFELLSRKALLPSAEEISRNPRARSAKLRVARLLDPMP